MHPNSRRTILGFLVALLALRVAGADTDFHILPYLQNPAPDAMTILWFSAEDAPGQLSYGKEDFTDEETITSTPILAEALAYPAWESDTFFDGEAPLPPYRHRVRLSHLEPNTTYTYTVEQGASRFSAAFKTSPLPDQPVRFVAYADCETEPESTGKHVKWADPTGASSDRLYLLDQTIGYANNLEVIQSRQPGFVAIAGDLVESGGEQRDWDEFWLHLTHPDGEKSLAGKVPYLAAPGNHDYYEGPSLGKYNQPGSERATNRFRTYFEFPPNNAPDSEQEGRYFRLDYGPVTLIALDVANDSPHRSEHDTNFFLRGENDAGGGHAPAFGPGSRQHAWLEAQLREAQAGSRFTFVIFHHVPYSVGPHGWPPGEEDEFDTQSGVPVRALTPLFLRYGVDAVIAGHDEIWERSEIAGVEVSPDGRERPHTIHFYDVGIGGDGLRGPQPGLVNPFQKFLAHTDAPEVWQDGVLIAGGKHYGHLEVDVVPMADGRWQAVLKPVHVFPLFAADGAYQGYERRLYDDVVTLTSAAPTAVTSGAAGLPTAYSLEAPYPNPFNSTVLLRYALPETGFVEMAVYDLLGQKIRILMKQEQPAGYYSLEWDARDDARSAVASGVYLVKFRAGAHSDTARVVLVR